MNFNCLSKTEVICKKHKPVGNPKSGVRNTFFFFFFDPLFLLFFDPLNCKYIVVLFSIFFLLFKIRHHVHHTKTAKKKHCHMMNDPKEKVDSFDDDRQELTEKPEARRISSKKLKPHSWKHSGDYFSFTTISDSFMMSF